jgi:hypothetical protein
MVQEGALARESLVRRGDEGEWVEASRVMGLNRSNSPSDSARELPPPQAAAAQPAPPPSAPPPFAPPPFAPPKALLPRAVPIPTAAPVAAPLPAAEPAAPIPIVAPRRGAARGRGRGNGARVRLPFAAMLAIVMVLGVSFGVAGVAIYLWRAGAEVSEEDEGQNVAVPGVADAHPATSPAVESPVARDDALLDSIGEWHDAKTSIVGPKGVAAFRIVSARLVSQQELEALDQPQTTPARRAAAEPVTTVAPKKEAAAKPGGTGAFEAALGEDVGTSREPPVVTAPAASADDDPPFIESGVIEATAPTDGESAGERNMLMVEVEIRNRSSEAALRYKGLNGFTNEQAAALLVDQYNKRCLPLPAAEGSSLRRVTEFEIAPGHPLTDVLVFPAPDPGFEFVRLALPSASIGRTGGVGFQISAAMIASQTGAVANYER